MKPQLTWLWCIEFMILPIIATEVCMECRPLELQKSPGIGIDLTMSYGTAALKFENGTILDVVKISGSAEYLSAMKVLAKDALGVRAGNFSSLPEIEFYPAEKPITLISIFLDFTLSRAYKFLVQQKQRLFPIRYTPRIKINPWMVPISDMLSTIKASINAVHQLKYPFIILSIPDFEADTGHIYELAFQIAAQEAGLEFFELSQSVNIASRSALAYYRIEDCYGTYENPDPGCPSADERVNVVLSVSYNGASLGVTLLTRWMIGRRWRGWGTFWPARLSETTSLGGDSSLRFEDPEKYWDSIKEAIETSIGSEKVDKVIFTGSHANDPGLRHTVDGLLGTTKDFSLGAKEGSEDVSFVVARGAAVTARTGMVHGFDACLVPDRCETVGDPDAVPLESKSEL